MLHVVRLAEDPPATAPLPEPQVHRGYILVPSDDLQRHVREQLLVFGAGLVVGIGIGALFGNVITRARNV